jgi:hypothetical protein
VSAGGLIVAALRVPSRRRNRQQLQLEGLTGRLRTKPRRKQRIRKVLTWNRHLLAWSAHQCAKARQVRETELRRRRLSPTNVTAMFCVGGAEYGLMINEVAEVCFSMLLGYMVQSALLDDVTTASHAKGFAALSRTKQLRERRA